MSQENVEVVRRWIEALNRRDVATMSDLWRSDGEVDWSRARGPLKGVYRGRSEYESLLNEFFSTFEKSEVETHGFTEAGSEVVMPHTTHFRGREGIELTASATWVYTVENGRITRLRLFQEEAEALEAAGLSE
jgi:ketosteroid isomerase-like protein